MASGGGFSYRPNVNRNVTKKWRDAARPTYDDDDWGDDGYGTYDEPPVPAPAHGSGWGGQMPPPSRSFTNPSPPRSTGRPSFDRGDDRRYVSAGGGFESAYPSTQRAPFPEQQHDDPAQQRFYAQHPALHVNTQSQGPYPPPGFRPSSRGQHPNDAPFSAPAPGTYQRSHSGSRSNPGGIQQRQGSPARPDSRSSNTSSRFHPPRKSSLSQEQAPPPSAIASNSEPDDAQTTSPSAPVKALPFIRPADIYKRFEEEKEKERQSLDSQRPSLELVTTKSRDSAASVKTATSENRDVPQEDSDSTRRLKPTLDTVVERKSEYGFDNMLKAADPAHPSVQGDGVHRQATNASSVYTDRPDPVSASTADDEKEDAEPSSAFSYQSTIPPLGRVSVFDPELTPAQTHTEPVPPLPSNLNQPTSTATDSKGETGPGGLNHQASLGYRSVVQQAFDESQHRRPASPTSTAETLPRSNSASTSELSPIISRRPDLSGGPSGPPVTEQTILEEPSSGTSARPLSESTIKSQDTAMPTPPAFQPGYRRDVTPPSRGNNSPARQANIRTSSEIVPQQGIVTTVGTEAPVVSQPEDEERGRARVPSDPTVTSPSASQASGVSEEYQQWRAHSKQFNTTLGLGSSPATPSVNTPITRAESPPKGTVKDLAGKYETNSGRSTPIDAPTEVQPRADTSHPKQQERMESFRPALPGGWQSFGTTSGSQTPQNEDQKPSFLGQQPMHQSTDSVPTAKAPQNWQQGPTNTAFAAAAAAGIALAGSFNGPALSGSKADTSDEESENEWDQSSNSSKPEHSDTRDFATSHQPTISEAGVQETRGTHSYGTTSSDILGKESTSDADAATSNIDYFPAPLRTSKSIEPGTVLRPPIPNVQGSTVHETDEVLQEEIVKSLTPRSSNFEGQPSEELVSKPLPISLPSEEKPPAPFAPESEDMYGGGSGQRTPASSSAQQLGFVSGHQPQYSVSSIGSAPQRPFLEQRFSWEMEQDGQMPTGANTGPRAGPSTPPKITSPVADSPETIKVPQAAEVDATAATSALNVAPSAPVDHNPLNDTHSPEANDGAPTAIAPGVLPAAMTSSPTEAKSFRNIMNINNQQDRIKALEDNRATYNQSDGMLEQWIQSMQQIPEHANIFQSNGRMWKDTGNNYNTQRQPSTKPMASITSSKVVQEDGKRLMAAAGRFGGKAGIAAKGLFAKGKDKLRSASTSDKGVQSKRKSGGPSSSTIAEESKSKRDSTFLIAPQIPAQDLQSSPIDGSSWFGSDREDTSGASSEKKPAGGEPTAEQKKTMEVGDETAALQNLEPTTSTSSGQVLHKQGADSEPTVTAAVPTVQIRSGSMEEPKDDDKDVTPTAAGQLVTASSQGENKHERKVSDMTEDERADTGHEQLLTSGALAATDDRRNSSISAVSSASPSPADGSHDEAVHRSISPAEHEERSSEPAPSYEEVAPPALTEATAAAATKDEEAAQDRAAADSQNDPVPSYEETPSRESRPQRVGADARILPVANLSQPRRNEPVAVSNRPFSFEGTERLQQAQQAYEQNQENQTVPSQPLSPVSQTASKDLSQVSVEEAPEEQVSKQNRQSKSYSRPFGADPVSDHPAFRQADQPIDRSQMYSTDAPPASIRRAQEEGERQRQQIRPSEESGYRIPGPYGQEYRSPKPRQTSTPSPTAAYSRQQSFPPSQEAPPTSVYQPPVVQQQYTPQVPSSLQQQQGQPVRPDGMNAPPVPEEIKPKKTFGAFFRGKTKPTPSPARGQSRGEDQYADAGKRPAFPTRDSRQDSVTSGQSSFGESRDVVGQLPPTEKSKRRFSRDVMKLGSPTPQEQAQQGKKKKRFSAMGNLFSRSDKADKTQPPQRSTTLPSNSVQPDRSQYPQQYQDPRVQHQQFSSSHAPGGYYGVSQQQDYMNYSQPSQTSGSYLQPGYSVGSPQGYESRPSDLRIDTSGQGRDIGQPATAPVQSYSRNNSYQGGGTYSSSRTQSFTNNHQAPTTRAPISAPAGQSSIDPHVVSLHKRSRSPTMGRRTSSEPEHADTLAPPNPARSSGGTPVDGLGTFVGKRISPVGGVPRSDEEQEAPFRIGIPGEDDQRRRTRQILIEQGRFKDANQLALASSSAAAAAAGGSSSERAKEPPPRTVADRMMNPGGAGGREPDAASATRAPLSREGTKDSSGKQMPGHVAELPGSKADGYESEEEIKMSATVKPGDWEMPVFV